MSSNNNGILDRYSVAAQMQQQKMGSTMNVPDRYGLLATMRPEKQQQKSVGASSSAPSNGISSEHDKILDRWSFAAAMQKNPPAKATTVADRYGMLATAKPQKHQQKSANAVSSLPTSSNGISKEQQSIMNGYDFAASMQKNPAAKATIGERFDQFALLQKLQKN